MAIFDKTTETSELPLIKQLINGGQEKNPTQIRDNISEDSVI